MLVLVLVALLSPPPLPGQDIDMDRVKADEFFRWGVIAFHDGYYNNAIQSFESALSLKPEDDLPRDWLGKAFYQSGLEEQALNEWDYIVQNGGGTQLLDSRIRFISYRRALGRELEEEERFILSSTIDANDGSYYAFSRPSSVKTRTDGTFYVVAFGSNEVLNIDSNNRIVDILNGGIEGYDHPFDIVEIDNRYLFISEYSRNRITKCNLAGEKILSFGSRGTGPGELLGPQYLAVDDKGYIYVTDFGNRRVSKFDYDGNFILSFGKKTDQFSGLPAPTGIAVMGGRIYVADRQERKIAIFDSSGNFIASRAKGLLNSPEGLTPFGPNNLLIADTTRVLDLDLEDETISSRGDIETYGKRVINAAIDANGNMLAVDFDLNRVFTFSRMASLYTGFFVQLVRIDATRFPEIVADVSVTNRAGKPVVGLKKENFRVSEFTRPIEEFEFYSASLDHSRMSLIIVVEKSNAANREQESIRKIVEAIYTSFNDNSRLKIVSAGQSPVVENDYGDTLLALKTAAVKEPFSDSWQFDESIRAAAAELLRSRGRKAIIFISQGGLGHKAYERYSLMELAQFLKNNSVQFNALHIGSDNVSPDIGYLCAATAGQQAFFYRPRGIEEIFRNIAQYVEPRYILKYTSAADTSFGKRYMQLAAEVTLQRKSGYDENGYFSALEF